MEDKRKKLIGIVGISIVLISVILIMVLWEYKLGVYIKNPELLRNWVESKGFIAQFLFVLMVIFQVICAVIPGEPFEMAAGYAFGAVEGTILSLIATTLGGIIVFLVVRAFGMKVVKLFFSEEKINSLSFLKTTRNKSILYFIIFMIPGTPKDLLCYFAGLTDMKLSLWIIISFFGRLPSILTSTIGGNLLGIKNYSTAIIVFVITMVICIAGIIIFYKITEKRKEK